ncbi:hypothetical protein A2697_05110 [Candidatus Curtissbacteria bacterium RIFCSPHIGHO2_01_FULL_41_44]|uniref:Glycosyltransferase n=1 Tax=Candidatus Curtissbacteria bacterium RIFCSPLOWO2_01_FULL_42_50 TaxID=1797730 RepID=A0A1F5H5K0_9BACT|nr:MAG: hypothetical protein A2697_05110 [Candidatus Curtissbacteria bacterium RIFCSPHIGHO2_01_FULL_41_44]OGD93788.1 MAG: hypothetical protein A3C33_03605 [Candidatus Curtissbacteria bacterium RIFCSPHIGHO2_02_FULL_42_58]OGD96828.1 MAG: hypothetical protein A3E71_02895 [Candidatus Curtissbacteria bacterium RIFCSPHIGHO2_12_FULL_42_33]OGD99452.1 MAG: hypothetical protein A3B54_00985 [Candidatus Curtissbacteria bacterium RIFCSPLOWO2_01_FULL_42_50]OGE03713.1 MAG: hypothetical protein A3G16_02485 [Ca
MDARRQKRTQLRPRINVLGVEVDDISQRKAVGTILEMAGDKEGGKYVVTVNSEFVMLAGRDPIFLKILNGADLAVADGQWLVWAKLIFGGKEHDRVTGVDLVEKLCERCAKKAISVGFLGGFGSVAEMAAKRQKSKNPTLPVVFADSGDPTMGQDSRLKKRFLAIGRVDILFVAYGMGQQEFWIKRNKNSLDVGVFIGVGGAFDYLSMVKKRAPMWLQGAGFEWLWRLMAEPWRAKRMLRVFPLFWVLVFWQWFKNLQNS